jgi:hypothetical protein
VPAHLLYGAALHRRRHQLLGTRNAAPPQLRHCLLAEGGCLVALDAIDFNAASTSNAWLQQSVQQRPAGGKQKQTCGVSGIAWRLGGVNLNS